MLQLAQQHNCKGYCITFSLDQLKSQTGDAYSSGTPCQKFLIEGTPSHKSKTYNLRFIGDVNLVSFQCELLCNTSLVIHIKVKNIVFLSEREVSLLNVLIIHVNYHKRFLFIFIKQIHCRNIYSFFEFMTQVVEVQSNKSPPSSNTF